MLRIKTIIRGNINNLRYWVHSPSFSPIRNITCNNVGEIIKYKKLNFETINNINIEKAYIIHFRTKSIDEYMNKFKRGYSNWFRIKKPIWIYWYLKNNIITKEVLEYFEQNYKVNLTEFKKKLH